jgi:CBS domain protein
MDRFNRRAGTDDYPRGVRALLERPPSVFEADAAAAVPKLFASDPKLEWIPILDGDSRPVALVERAAEGAQPLLAPVNTIEPDVSPPAAARLAMEREASVRLVPFVRCDSRGRFVAIVRIERIIDALAEHYRRGRRAEDVAPPLGVDDLL